VPATARLALHDREIFISIAIAGAILAPAAGRPHVAAGSVSAKMKAQIRRSTFAPSSDSGSHSAS